MTRLNYKWLSWIIPQDYEDFDLANEMDELEEFLKVEPPASGKENVPDSNQSEEIQENGNTTSREVNIIGNCKVQL